MIAPKREPALLTIGYEGLELSDFIKHLAWHKVDILVDVREIPISRKRGFSKSALASVMAQHGIGYVHLKALGSPRAIRNQLKNDLDYHRFFSSYDQHLEAQQEALMALEDIIEENQRVCLLCFEKNHDQCHRSRVARKMEQIFKGRVVVEPVKTWQ